MTWGTVTNGYGPPERDRSNGEQGATDGVPIRVANIAYPKGVGAHANSTIPLDLTGLNCTRFQSVIGVDDEVANNGSVRFQVWNGTTTMLTQSAVITGASATATIDLNITGITNLRLVVTNNADGDAYDHADWADAKLTCGSVTDTTAPTVVTVTPPDGATGISVTAAPVAQLSEPLNATTVTASTVQLATQPGGVAVTGTVTYDNTSRSITFTPTSALTPNTGYRLQLLGGPTGIADPAGNHLAATATSTFTTAPADTTAPTVVTVTPPDGATGISVTAAPVAQLSEPLNATTVTASTVQLATQPGGVAVTGTVTYDNTSRSITFTPTSALTPNTGYRLQLLGGPTGIADLAGNRLATVNTTFTTGSATATTSYVSDMTWGTVTNGYGPPERDRSNGEQGATDGVPIRVANIAYPKGVGAHANSTIPLDLTGLNCTRFQSVIGVDDEVANNGSVRFQVWNGTTTMLTQSAVITGASATATIDLNITGITNLRLVVTNNADGDAYDHADWADAKLTCGS